jgi:hypothetical protein
MITGDAKETATAIAKSIGIYNPERDQTLSGAQLESMSEVCWFRGEETVHDVFLPDVAVPDRQLANAERPIGSCGRFDWHKDEWTRGPR